ncbi:hypothetical protein ABIA32_000760 [Streptacidiphilus sp. MAP12-20]|uniref:hypothetical protein n=1 Tax=Streptacidiphilus sp. MAP12-20 TaxID=3156299 RepID=UPI00351222EE
MAFCRTCGHVLSAAAERFCTNCGASLQPGTPPPADAPAETLTIQALPALPAPPLPRGRHRLTLLVLAAAVTLALSAGITLLLTHGTGNHPAGAQAAVVTPSTTAMPTTQPTQPSPSSSPTSSPTPSPSLTSATPTPSAATPDGVVTAYYSAINRHDYQAAWNLGGDNLGQSYATFSSGFANTVKDTLTITGNTGDTVDVAIDAQHSDGTVLHFLGSYTVQNGVITQAQLRAA